MMKTFAEAASQQITTTDEDKQADIEGCPDTQEGQYRQTDNDSQSHAHPASICSLSFSGICQKDDDTGRKALIADTSILAILAPTPISRIALVSIMQPLY